jgi:ubiquitin C
MAHELQSSQLFVETRAGKSITHEADSSDSINCVKHKIQNQVGALVELQRLIFSGNQLKDGRSLCLSDYNMPIEATLHLVLCLHGGMQVLVKTLMGKAITLELKSSDSIDDLKQKVQEKEGISLDQQLLILASKQLEELHVASTWVEEGG